MFQSRYLILNISFSDETNRACLEKIEDCIFVLCLDDAIPIAFNHQRSFDETQSNLRDDTSMALQMLHGFGANVNSANRWYDKTMQVNDVTILNFKPSTFSSRIP